MAGWFDGLAVTSHGINQAGIDDPKLVQTTVGYLHDFTGVVPSDNAIINCRIQVVVGVPQGMPAVAVSLGLVQQPWFQFVGAVSGPPLGNGTILNLGTQIVGDTNLMTLPFQIRALPSVRAARPARLTAYIHTAFGELRPQVNVADEPIVVVRQPGPTASIEVLSPVYDQTYMTVLQEGLAGDAIWIRGGSQIAYMSYAAGRAQLYVVDASGHAPHRVTTTGPLSGMTCGSPCTVDVNTVVLHAIAPGEAHWSIWQVSLDGSNQKRLTPADNADYLYPIHGLVGGNPQGGLSDGFRCIRRSSLLPGPFVSPKVHSIVDFDYNGNMHRGYLADAAHQYAGLTAPLNDYTTAHVTSVTNSTNTALNQITIATYYNNIAPRPPWLPPAPIPDDHRFAMVAGQFQGNSPAFSSDMSSIAFVRGGHLIKKLFNASNLGPSPEVVIGDGFYDSASVSWRHP